MIITQGRAHGAVLSRDLETRLVVQFHLFTRTIMGQMEMWHRVFSRLFKTATVELAACRIMMDKLFHFNATMGQVVWRIGAINTVWLAQLLLY
jgi:peroxiredoxin family protein